MSAFDSIVFSSDSIIFSAAACILLAAVPVLFWLIWRRGHKEQINFRYLLVGALGFLVSARVLELGVHLVCIVFDNPISRFINGSHLAYIAYGITMAGVFEECGRYVVLRYIMKKNKTRENAIMYGIGHGGIEVLAVTLPVYALYLAIGVLFSDFDAAQAMALLNIDASTAAAALPTVQAAAAFDLTGCIVCVLERIMCMFVHIGLTVVVYHAVQSAKPVYLLYAVLLHMATDLLPAMLQRGLVSVWICELWLLICTVIICIFALRLYRSPENTNH